MKLAMLPLAALFATGIVGNAVLNVATADSHSEADSTEEVKVVALTDPEIAAAEDEEPDCD